MTKTSKIVLAFLAVLVLAIGGGLLGAGFRGSPAAAAGDAGNGAFIEKIKERGELRVGVAIAPPMTVQQEDGTLGGANLIPLEKLADQLGVKLVPVAAEWKNIVAGLQADRYDFAANLDYTVERSLAIQFTDPVYSYPGAFVVKANSDYVTSNDVLQAGGQIVVAQGAAPAAALEQFTDKIMPMDSYANAVQAVNANRAIAEFADLPTAESQALADDSLKIIVPEPAIFQSSTGYGVPASADQRSLQIVNIAIDRAKSEGVLTKAYAESNYVEADNLGDLRKK
ncbi:transporter substrate-binding domain-containing protein [Arthrobacter ginkgonis]|uniref:Transporter substrate-binding domain-containing protein n=2 Tax=Actinomycetes TaxID=1760 RepID=A0ABP7BT92_9MICC